MQKDYAMPNEPKQFVISLTGQGKQEVKQKISGAINEIKKTVADALNVNLITQSLSEELTLASNLICCTITPKTLLTLNTDEKRNIFLKKHFGENLANPKIKKLVLLLNNQTTLHNSQKNYHHFLTKLCATQQPPLEFTKAIIDSKEDGFIDFCTVIIRETTEYSKPALTLEQKINGIEKYKHDKKLLKIKPLIEKIETLHSANHGNNQLTSICENLTTLTISMLTEYEKDKTLSPIINDAADYTLKHCQGMIETSLAETDEEKTSRETKVHKLHDNFVAYFQASPLGQTVIKGAITFSFTLLGAALGTVAGGLIGLATIWGALPGLAIGAAAGAAAGGTLSYAANKALDKYIFYPANIRAKLLPEIKNAADAIEEHTINRIPKPT